MTNKKNLPEICEIMGHQVELRNIDNPHLRKAITRRADFLFRYNEAEDYDDLPYPGYQALDSGEEDPGDMD
jgi:hypothetical protein